MLAHRSLFAAILFAAAGCADPTLPPLPLEIGLQVSRTTTVPGDTLNFLVTTQGGSLIDVAIEFADGSSDNFAAGGARTARITFRHAYIVTGTFQVKAVVQDALAGLKEATIQVVVN
jgi:hypothetical protein